MAKNGEYSLFISNKLCSFVESPYLINRLKVWKQQFLIRYNNIC